MSTPDCKIKSQATKGTCQNFTNYENLESRFSSFFVWQRLKGCEKRLKGQLDLPDIDQDHPVGGLMDPGGLIFVGSGQCGTQSPCSACKAGKAPSY